MTDLPLWIAVALLAIAVLALWVVQHGLRKQVARLSRPFVVSKVNLPAGGLAAEFLQRSLARGLDLAPRKCSICGEDHLAQAAGAVPDGAVQGLLADLFPSKPAAAPGAPAAQQRSSSDEGEEVGAGQKPAGSAPTSASRGPGVTARELRAARLRKIEDAAAKVQATARSIADELSGADLTGEVLDGTGQLDDGGGELSGLGVGLAAAADPAGGVLGTAGGGACGRSAQGDSSSVGSPGAGTPGAGGLTVEGASDTTGVDDSSAGRVREGGAR